MKTERYTFGEINKPKWFTEACESGKIRIIEDDEGIKTAKVSSGASEYIANIGDIIVKTMNGLVVTKKVDKVKINDKEKVDDIS